MIKQHRARSARCIQPMVFALLLVVGSGPSAQAQQRTAQDDVVDREMAIARPTVQHLAQLLDAQLLPISQGKQSTEVDAVMRDAAAKHPNINDLSVPLHIRLIERQRLSFVAGVTWATGVLGHCGDPDFTPSQLLDASVRQQIHEAIRCRMDELERLQRGIHKLDKEREDSVILLKLPPYSQQVMLNEARLHTKQQDDAIESTFRTRRALLGANEDLFNFMDGHSDGAQFTNNQLLFKNQADAQTAHDLMIKVAAAVQAQQ